MSENEQNTENVRASIRYVSDEPGEISLPGYLNPIPSIVEPGDEFTIDGSFADEVLASNRFEEGDPIEVVVEEPAAKSPNESLTKAELGEKLGLDEATVDSSLKDELVAQADARDLATAAVFVPNPQPVGGVDDVLTDTDDTEDTPNE